MGAGLPMTEPSPSKSMPVFGFLEGEGKDGPGRSIDAVLAFDDAAVERIHDFIQWLFPLPEPSRAQPQSPIPSPDEIKVIRASSEAQANLERATGMMTAFYRRNDHWLRSHDHNHLRISRIIHSLALLLSKEAAQGF